MSEIRELDALVAEKIMGWTVTAPNWGNRTVYPPFEDCDCTSHSEAATVPFFSTDVAAAWEVVERMYSTHDYWMRLEYEAPDWTGVDFIRVDGPIHRATAPTPPLAICLAALRAVGHTD